MEDQHDILSYHNSILYMLEQYKSWNCEMMLNEAPTLEDNPNYIDFSAELVSPAPYYFPEHFDGTQWKRNITISLRVMCIESGFNFIHRISKSTKQLSIDQGVYLTLCCQHSMVYRNQKIKNVRQTTTKWCTHGIENCTFCKIVTLYKVTDRWISCKSFKVDSSKMLRHTGHIRLDSQSMTASSSIIDEKAIDLMFHCTQASINNGQIANLTTIRIIFGTNFIWNRIHVNYIKNRKDPFESFERFGRNWTALKLQF